jgi:hypothetical protein
MKWVSLIVLLGTTLPLVPYLRSNIRLVKIVWVLVGFVPFVMESVHLYMSAISWAEWPGYVKGLELTIVDALALSLYLSQPRATSPLPFRIAFGLYILASFLSVLSAIVPEAAFFYLWQTARMFLLYATVVRACNNPVVATALLKGMAAGLVLEAVVVLWQRFGLGVLQASGTMIHQNELGMVSHFIVFPFFALLLTGRAGLWPAIVFPAGVIVELLTTSRGTIGLAALGYVLVFAFSALRGWTSRKGRVLLVFMVAAAVAAPLAAAALSQRGSQAVEDSDKSRVYLENMASMMLADHPLGVGGNNFVYSAIAEGYYARAAASNYFAFTVHNVYWLSVVEIGYLGLISFVIYIAGPLIVAFRCGVRNQRDIRGDLLIGLGVGTLVVYLHSFEEWIFITYRLQYFFVMDIGLIVALAMQMGYWRPPVLNRQESQSRSRRAPPEPSLASHRHH